MWSTRIFRKLSSCSISPSSACPIPRVQVPTATCLRWATQVGHIGHKGQVVVERVNRNLVGQLLHHLKGVFVAIRSAQRGIVQGQDPLKIGVVKSAVVPAQEPILGGSNCRSAQAAQRNAWLTR